jgi:FkbM family methyltransferase
MLIDLFSLLQKYKLNVTGILHVGASVCEELNMYIKCGLTNENIYWIEGNEDNIQSVKTTLANDVKIFNCLIDDKDNVEVDFNISNALMSSSLLDFGSHSHHHKGIIMVEKRKKKTIRLDTFIGENKIPIGELNFLNVDIQGTELRAIKSLGKYLNNIDFIMTEVNTEYVYKNCTLLNELDKFLNENGFIRVEIKIYGNCGWGDAFYIRTRILDDNKDYYRGNIFKSYKTSLKGEEIFFDI